MNVCAGVCVRARVCAFVYVCVCVCEYVSVCIIYSGVTRTMENMVAPSTG